MRDIRIGFHVAADSQSIYRYGVAWTSSRIAHCIDGGSITSQVLAGPFASLVCIAVGCAPWSTTSATTLSNVAHRTFLHAPVTVTDAFAPGVMLV